MADYVAIQNANLEPGAPWISSTAFALRDNPVAIAEGAPGAPRIVNAAVTNGTLGAEKFQTGATERNWVLARTAAASAGAVGTYAMLRTASAVGQSSEVRSGATFSGSSLRYTNAEGFINTGNPDTPAGTWRLVGYLGGLASDETNRQRRTSVWLRIS